MSMNDNKYQNIEELLPRFCDGLTTEEERRKYAGRRMDC